MKPKPPTPVKLFCGVLFSDCQLLENARTKLHEKFGEIDFESQAIPFAISEYYRQEMGWPIERIFWSFERLIAPQEIAQIKIDCNELEDRLAIDGCRKVNLDPGYLDYDKIVLASAKYNGQKIYLNHGIYADLTLHYEKGNYYPYPWSFPDFKSGQYNKIFLRIRELYKAQLKKH
ncbi:MAG: DUF4416 family protein [candidate division KSB1 bacterium]|nr:DUF4416 family protein [candidate division KSB1 bacterium]